MGYDGLARDARKFIYFIICLDSMFTCIFAKTNLFYSVFFR
jgi:hypothetical protein